MAILEMTPWTYPCIALFQDSVIIVMSIVQLLGSIEIAARDRKKMCVVGRLVAKHETRTKRDWTLEP